MTNINTSASGASLPDVTPPTQDAEAIRTRERSHVQVAAKRFLRHKPAMVSVVMLVLLILFAFVVPMIWPYGYGINREIPKNLAWFESWEHPFGTTQVGHDLAAQLMRGLRNSMLVGLLAAAIGTTVGTIFGTVAGYYRGWVDTVLMRFVDVIIVVPFLVVVLVVAGAFPGGASWYTVGILIGAFAWTIDSRVVRGQVLSLRENDYIEAAHAMGASDWRIIVRHLLPNVVSTIIVVFTLAIAAAIIVESILAFLGFGIRPPDVSLGFMIQDADTAVRTRPWLFYPPGILIVLLVLSISFIGDGLRDALDPKQTRVRE